MSCTHLTTFERGKLELLYSQGKSTRSIARKLWRHHSSIALELINNRPRKCLDWKTAYESFMDDKNLGFSFINFYTFYIFYCYVL